MKVLRAPKKVFELIEKYQNIPAGDKTVCTPYFINTGGDRNLRALVGKGDPSEIDMELQILAHRKGVDLAKIPADKIREMMQENNIGIDCSGFVSHLLDEWLKANWKKKLIS
ncbi:MAG: hypothetical protein KDD60_12240, partial [Bdellovibrionales bacterium]|nr:hypothetical protein [Bdellovibrionales bacterium]